MRFMSTTTKKLSFALSMLALGSAWLRADEPGKLAPAPAAPPVATPAPATPAPATTTAAPATNGPAPKIVFASPTYDFGKAKAGDPIKYRSEERRVGKEC